MDIRQEYRQYLMSLILPSDGSNGQLGAGSDSTALSLFESLDEVPFKVLVPMDENRIMDAMDLREMFTNGDVSRAEKMTTQPVTLLEILINLCMFLAYARENLVYDSSTERWFYELLANAGIDEKTPRWRVIQIGRRIVNREYGADGEGGFFPCFGFGHGSRYAGRNDGEERSYDMRETELWMQMNEYLMERYHV